MGFRYSVSLLPAIQATELLILTLTGLFPAEHTSLSWTHNRTCWTPASGSSVLILLTEPETNQAIPQLAHNFAALPAILDVVNDPGHRKGKFVHDRIQKLFLVYVTFVGSAAQPIPPQPLSMMMNITQRPIVATYTIVLIVATKLDTQHLILLF